LNVCSFGLGKDTYFLSLKAHALFKFIRKKDDLPQDDSDDES